MILRRRAALAGGVALAGGFMLARLGTRPAFGQDALVLGGHAMQGGLVIGTVPQGTKVVVDKTNVRASDGVFCFGFTRDAAEARTVAATFPDGTAATQTVMPAKRDYDIQRVNGLDEKYVSPPKEVLDRIARDSKAVGAARAFDTGETWFTEPFDWPADGPVSSVYGSQRILNGEPREPHYGVDVAAPEGAPVKAPAAGIVRLAEDLYLSGNTIVLDHGHGVSTSYLHMSRLDVKPGDKLARGDIMGAIGHTGRATGPHTCWRLNWFQTRLDVALVAKPHA